MSENAAGNLRNVIVFALADGQMTDEEKQYIDSLREKLGIDAGEFAKLCDRVRQDPRKLALPRDEGEAEEAIRLLVETAAVDGRITPGEHRLLRRLARHAGMSPHRLEAMLDAASGPSPQEQMRIEAIVREIYAEFNKWDADTRGAKLNELADMGRAAVEPLLRILESYRNPDGADNALELKTLVARCLGRLADVRAVYYLAQQVTIGDSDDETSNAALRGAAAEAIGGIVGQPFGADAAGIEAAREWWNSDRSKEHQQVAF